MYRVLLPLLCGCQLIFKLADDPSVPGDGPGDTSDANNVPVRCSPMTLLTDDFAGTALSNAWISQGQGTAVVDDAVTVSVTSADNYGGHEVLSRHFYDISNTTFAVDMSNITSSEGNVGFELKDAETSIKYSITIKGTRILGFTDVPGDPNGPQARGDIEYRPGMHVRFQIRVTDTEIFWEANDDTGSMVGFGSETGVLRFVRPRLFANAGEMADTSTVTFDNVGSGPPSGIACPIGMAADSFDARLDLGPMWARSSTITGNFTIDGSLRANLVPGDFNSLLLVSSTVFDLTTEPFSAEVASVGSEGTVRFGIEFDDTSTLDFDFNPALSPNLAIKHTGMNVAVIDSGEPYNATAHRWWRFRFQAAAPPAPATLFFETSPDNTSASTWSVLGRTSDPTYLSRLTMATVRFDFFGDPNSNTSFEIGSVGP